MTLAKAFAAAVACLTACSSPDTSADRPADGDLPLAPSRTQDGSPSLPRGAADAAPLPPTTPDAGVSDAIVSLARPDAQPNPPTPSDAGGGTASASVARSGSRLKLIHLVSPDGLKETLRHRVFDSVRMEACQFDPAADGKLRCLPSDFFGVDDYYTDPGCKNRIVGGWSYGGSAKVGLQEMTDESFRVFERGTKLSIRTTYSKDGGECFSDGQFAASDVFYTVGAEIPPDRFAELKRSTALLTPHAMIAGQIVTSADGLMLVTELRESTTSRGACDLVELPNAAICMDAVHSGPRPAPLYADARCEKPLGAMAFEHGIYIKRLHIAGTEEIYRAEFLPDADLARFPVVNYEKHAGGCGRLDLNAGNAFRLGARVELTGVPRAAVEVRGNGRLKLKAVVYPGLEPFFLGWHDTRFGQACEEGDSRCLPPWRVTAESYFSDSRCSKELPLIEVPAGVDPASYVYTDETGKARRPDARHMGRYYRMVLSGDCLDGNSTSRVLHTSKEVPSGEFVELREVVEP